MILAGPFCVITANWSTIRTIRQLYNENIFTLRYKKISRTFWIRGNVSDTFEQRVSVILSTPSDRNVSFSIRLYEVTDFATSPTLMRNPEEARNITELVEGVLDQGWMADFNSS